MAINPYEYKENDKRFPTSVGGDDGKFLQVDEGNDKYIHATPPGSFPTGTVIMHIATTGNIPAGFLVMGDDVEYAQATYPALWAALSAEGHTESSPGNFKTPVVNFAKNGAGASVLTVESAEVGTHGHTADAVSNHSHSLTINSAGNHTHPSAAASSGISANASGTSAAAQEGYNTGSGGAHGHSGSIGNGGGHTPSINDHTGTNQPECTLLTFLIKT